MATALKLYGIETKIMVWFSFQSSLCIWRVMNMSANSNLLASWLYWAMPVVTGCFKCQFVTDGVGKL